MGSLLDEKITWAEFGKKHLDRRIAKAITDTLRLERPTLVQSQGIPVALEGKDLLCRARTGSGKTLCYGVPLVQKLLKEAEAKGSSTPLAGLILVPTKELIAQVQGVINSLLTFCYDVLTVEALLSGQRYLKAELPSILVTTPSSLLAMVSQRQTQGSMRPLAETLRVLVVDEADLMFSFGYEEDVRALCSLMPSSYQALLVSATLSEEVEQLKGLMLHKPVVLRLEEPRVTGKLSQFYLVCHWRDKFLILYTLLKLQLVSGKTLMFVKSIEAAYKMKIFFERFSIPSAVLNAELPHASRQNIIQSFNQSLIELLIATDEGFHDSSLADEGEEDAEGEEAPEEEEPAPEATEEPKKKKGKKKKLSKATAEAEAEAAAEEVAEEPKKKKRKKKKAEEPEEAAAEEPAVTETVIRVSTEPSTARFGKKRKPKADDQFSITRGVDLQGVSTVINADVPLTVRDYVHRVGRCARGGASGTALTLCSEEEEPLLQKILRAQKAKGGLNEIKPLPMQISDAERFRYRVEDISRGLTKTAVSEFRARELQVEALHSEKLKAYFEEHPEERALLQRTQRQLKERKSIRAHLQHIPSYLVPANFVATNPVQQAVRREAAAQGGVAAGTTRRRILHAHRKDPLQNFASRASFKSSRAARFNRERMVAIEKRINPATANIEDLPPISGRKLWKLRHGKKVRKKTEQFGERKKLSRGEKMRKKKFGH